MSVRLQFQGIRCFPTKQVAVIRPLTLLVGENSSGKTTFLALCNIAESIILGLVSEPSFNSTPFQLGAYEQIASRISTGAVQSFSVTCASDLGRVEAEFVPESGQPLLSMWRLCAEDISLTVEQHSESGMVTLRFRSKRGERVLKKERFSLALSWLLGEPVLGLEEPILAELKPIVRRRDLDNLHSTLQSIIAEFGRAPYAFAPIRPAPTRTYDPVRLSPSPEGSHVPMLLAELSRPRMKQTWKGLRVNLNRFGKESGLFEQIGVVRKGVKESDPFQIGVQIGGDSFNLMDVGYGVSQVLPILVDTLQRSGVNDVFLLQQPEVHLHPSAQAELGSYFARQVRKNGRFVIETHSDYIVDRIRLEVRRKTLRPEDVSLLYFKRGKHGATIHHIELASDGSIVNPPTGYRQFFLKEAGRLLDY